MVTMTLTVDASASISTGMNIPDNYVDISQLSTMALASHARELIQLHHVDEIQPLFARLQQQQQQMAQMQEQMQEDWTQAGSEFFFQPAGPPWEARRKGACRPAA